MSGGKDNKRRKQAMDRLWFQVHSWIGLKLSLFMTLLLVTGTIAVFSSEIDWLLNPEMRAQQAVPESQVAWGAAYDNLRTANPDRQVFALGRYEWSAVALQASELTPWRENVFTWVNPADGAVQGTTSRYSVQRFFRNSHRHLMLPARIGIPIVTLMAFPLLISLIAGFMSYKKFWRGFFKKPRFHKKTRIWVGDVHRLAGLWTSWFIAIIALTSVFYFAEEMGLRGTPFPRPQPVAERSSSLPDGFTGADLDRAIEVARGELPGLEVRRVTFPFNAEAPIVISGELSAILVRPRANTVYVDPLTLESRGSYRGEQLDLYTRISEASDPLHFGYFAGYWSKWLWFLLGVAMSGLAITGVIIYAKRVYGSVIFDKRSNKKQVDSPAKTARRKLSGSSV